jgi:hypothetical protein
MDATKFHLIPTAVPYSESHRKPYQSVSTVRPPSVVNDWESESLLL